MSMKKIGRPRRAVHGALDLLGGDDEPCEPVEATTTSARASSASTSSRPTARPVESPRERLGAFRRAVGDDDLADTARDEVRRGQVAVFPAPRSRIRRPARSSKTRSASWAAADETEAGFSPMAVSVRTRLPDPQGLAEEAVEGRPGRVGLARGLVGLPHLAEDLRFPGHHRVEAGRDPEEVQRCRFVANRVERRRELGVGQAREVGELAVDPLLELAGLGAHASRPRCGCRWRALPPRRRLTASRPSASRRSPRVVGEQLPSSTGARWYEVPTRRRRIRSGRRVSGRGGRGRRAGSRRARGTRCAGRASRPPSGGRGTPRRRPR